MDLKSIIIGIIIATVGSTLAGLIVHALTKNNTMVVVIIVGVIITTLATMTHRR